MRVHDIGLRLHKNGAGESGFEVIVGGGLGRTPFVGKTIKPFLPKRDLLSYVEAILRVYNQYGRRDNIYKARIKILVHEMGAEKFGAEVDAEWQNIKDGALAIDPAFIADIAARFRYPKYESLADDHRTHAGAQPQFALRYVVPQLRFTAQAARLFDRDAVAEARGRAAGRRDVRADGCNRQTSRIALVLAKSASATSRTSCCRTSRSATYRRFGSSSIKIGVATPNVGLVSDIIACPGLDYCSLANTRSIPVAQELTRRFKNLGAQREIGRLHINISGCINACGHHHVGHIGILGVEKNGQEFYQITLGRPCRREGGAWVPCWGPRSPMREVADVIEDVVAAYVELRDRPNELFVDTVKRIGVEPFKERVYAAR